MPSPRQRSGQPIPWPGSAPDTLQLTLYRDDMADPAPPADQSVYLVSYSADEKIVVTRQQTDARGKTVFSGLDVSGGTSYFVMTLLPRGAVYERLLAGPLVMPGQTGVALALSGEKSLSTAPAVDDLLTVQRVEGAAPPAGQVSVELQGGPPAEGTVTLHDAATGAQLAAAPYGAAAPDADNVTGTSMFAARPSAAPGSLELLVLGPDGEPYGDAEVAVVPASFQGSPFLGESQALAVKPVLAKSSATGAIVLANLGTGSLVAVIRVSGKELRSDPFDLSKQGGAVGFQTHWSRAWPRASVDASSQPPGKVVYAQTEVGGKRYRSLPFQLAPDRGARTMVLVLPRVMFHFSLTSSFEEDYLALRGRLTLNNSSWFPYRETEDGLMLPLPRGFKGAQVTEQDSADVSPVPGEGLRFLRPLSPGTRTIIAGWSMPARDGQVQWDLPLPYGAFQSGMEIMQFPGLTVDLPAGVKGETAKVAKGSFFVLPEITILPNQRMVMTIRGLPAVPAWKIQAPRVVGVLVLLVLLGGIAVVARKSKRGTSADDREQTAQAARTAEIDQLLEELVGLEGSDDQARRDEIMARLEKLWPTSGADPASADGRAREAS